MTTAVKPKKGSSTLLQTAVQDTRNHQARDAAKKRAAGDHVDYETFKNRVAVAHLIPLQSTPRPSAGKTCPAWQFQASGQASSKEAPCRVPSQAQAAQIPKEPHHHLLDGGHSRPAMNEGSSE
ncbi:hypothetical protein WJX74_007524 [Apatococcus lobatus]|uniref:Dynein attachment factor N-terminal domain-containing protein n=2 Tax=Apatococcus TaxID=904362 RepID=A0AAW1SKA7_9CHLO